MELTASALQAVDTNNNVVFTNTAIPGSNCIIHRSDSGVIILKGITNQKRARFKITFSANIGIPTGGTVKAISLAGTLGGEILKPTIMTVTPADVLQFFNISKTFFIDVPCGCCEQISIKNITDETIDVINADLIIERVA